MCVSVFGVGEAGREDVGAHQTSGQTAVVGLRAKWNKQNKSNSTRGRGCWRRGDGGKRHTANDKLRITPVAARLCIRYDDIMWVRICICTDLLLPRAILYHHRRCCRCCAPHDRPDRERWLSKIFTTAVAVGRSRSTEKRRPLSARHDDGDFSSSSLFRLCVQNTTMGIR